MHLWKHFLNIKNSRLAEEIVNTMTVKQNKNSYTFKRK